MRKVEDQDIQSDDSGDLRQDELININRHFKNRRTNRNNKMTTEMDTMYKDALMNVIFGQFEQASKKLKHLISLYPDNPDAFHLLGTMHQQLGQKDKAVQYFFMSTYLSPPNIQKWIKVADMSMESKMYTQAAYCYGRALKIQNYNIQLMTKRAQAFQMSHQTKKAICTYKKILSINNNLIILKKYAKLKFRREEYSSSRQILKTCENYIKDPNLVYMICETFLKENKYQDILKEIGMHLDSIQTQNSEDDVKDLKNQPLQFVKIVYISCIILKKHTFQYFKNTVQEMKIILLQNYEQGLSQLYQDIIQRLKQEQEIRYCFTELLIKHPPHKTIKNYLFISQYLKNKHQYIKAIEYLKQGLKLHDHSAQLSSQLNHLQVISGKLKSSKWNQKKKNSFDQSNLLKSKMFQDDQIFYSSEEQEQNSENIKFLQKNDKKKIKQIKRTEKNKIIQKQEVNTKQMENDNPQVIKQLLHNSYVTLESILQKKLQQKEEIAFNNKQVENCLQYLIKVTQNCKQKNKQQKQGLFHRVQARRRYFSSKRNTKLSLIQINVQIICKILQNCIRYFDRLLKLGEYLKIKYLCQLLSKGYFFRWQNRNKQLKRLKTLVYQMGLLVCLILKKLDSATYFIRYLVNRHPQNEFYLLVVTYLIHNSQNKQCINSLLSKHLNKQQSNIQEKEVQQGQNKIFSQSQEDQNFKKHQTQLQMKKNNKSLINVNLNYLLGIQYMQTGCFQLAISSFLKIINQMSESMKTTVWLSLSTCLLQLSSSRTTHAKLLHTNRSSYCFLQYLKHTNNSIESRYNKARWLAQIKLNDKAIKEYHQLLNMQISESLKDRCALNLLCIYKQMQNWPMIEQISRQYFNAQKYAQKHILQDRSKIEIEQQILRQDKKFLQKQFIFQDE